LVAEATATCPLPDVDLAFEISASDGIRLVWAYLLGLLETARVAATNHPRPRGLRRAPPAVSRRPQSENTARAGVGRGGPGQQVLFATHEPRDRLERCSTGCLCSTCPSTIVSGASGVADGRKALAIRD
jgi:hypothetical protein